MLQVCTSCACHAGRRAARWAVAAHIGMGRAAGMHVACAPVGVVGGGFELLQVRTLRGCSAGRQALIGMGRANGHPVSWCARRVRAAQGNRRRGGLWAMAPIGMGRGASGVTVSGATSPCWDAALGGCARHSRAREKKKYVPAINSIRY